jgi:hypothetical protein
VLQQADAGVFGQHLHHVVQHGTNGKKALGGGTDVVQATLYILIECRPPISGDLFYYGPGGRNLLQAILPHHMQKEDKCTDKEGGQDLMRSPERCPVPV